MISKALSPGTMLLVKKWQQVCPFLGSVEASYAAALPWVWLYPGDIGMILGVIFFNDYETFIILLLRGRILIEPVNDQTSGYLTYVDGRSFPEWTR